MQLSTDLPACCLRLWDPRDKAALARHANNRKVWRNLTDLFPHPYTEGDAEYWVSYANQCAPSIHLAIALGGEAVGGIGIIAGEGQSCHVGQFGYWLGEAHWGKGLATAAARAMVAHAFHASLFVRLEARLYAWNPPSMRVLEKVGFVREGVLSRSVQKDGHVIDSIVYAKVAGGVSRQGA